MPYTIAIFPEFDELDKVKDIIKKYYPDTNELDPHIALVYYFNDKPSLEKIKNAVKDISSFDIRIDRLRAPSDSKYIFLDISEGREDIVSLKELLYDSLDLKWEKKFLYEPHVTLAKIRDKVKREFALKEIKNMGLNIFCKVDSFFLLEMNDDLMTLKSNKKIDLA